MNWLSSLVVGIFLSQSVAASGLPVVDTNEALKQVSDSLYLITSIENLMKEATGTTLDATAVEDLRRELVQLQSDISLYRSLSQGVDDLSQPSDSKTRVFVDQVNSISSHLRKLKVLIALAQSIRARPDAVNTSLNLLKEQRQREKEKYDLTLQALEEKQKIEDRRRRITARITFLRKMKKEMQIIGRYSEGVPISNINQYSRQERAALLW